MSDKRWLQFHMWITASNYHILVQTKNSKNADDSFLYYIQIDGSIDRKRTVWNWFQQINHRQAYHLEIVLVRRARSKTFDEQHDEHRGQK